MKYISFRIIILHIAPLRTLAIIERISGWWHIADSAFVGRISLHVSETLVVDDAVRLILEKKIGCI